MRIDSVRNFMMNAAPGTKFLPAQMKNTNKAADSFSISDAAQRLSINLQKASKLAKAELTESLPAFGKEIDAKMKRAVNILERMKELTVLAQDESLGDDARVEIQIEIEDLRDNFMIIPYNIMSERQFSTQSQQYEHTGELEIMRRSADGSTILERMRERIRNGEEWDVREAWRPEALLRVTKDDSGSDVAEVYEAGWYVVDDSSIITQDKDSKFIERGKSVPTVREQLEWRTPYVVMDAESAEKSTELIDKQIEEIQAWREKMPDLVEKMQDETSIRTEAYMFLRDIVVPAEKGHLPLNMPDEPSYFLFGDKVYDSPFVSHKIEDYNKVGSDFDYSLADESFKDKAELTGSYSVQSLSSNSVSLTRPSDAGFVYVKGINFHKSS